MTRLLRTIPVMVFVGVAAGFAQDSKGGDAMHPRVKMETTLGDFVLELDAEKAPITVLNFIRYVQDEYYDGTVFHRVIPNFMIQAGGFTVEMDKKSDGLRPPIKNEWKNGLKNVAGTIAMARTQAADSATSQFFINVTDNANLDAPRGGAAYCVFGKVVEGMDVIEKIRNTPCETHPKYGGGRSAVVPVEPVVFKSARVVGEFDRKKLEANIKDVEKQAKELKKKVAAERIENMKEYVAKIEKETGKKAVTTDSGLAYVVLTEGDGATPKTTDRVEVHYTGWLLDGTKFDSSVDRGAPSTFGVTQVIKGWIEGLQLMKVGSKYKFIIPSELAYGKRGSGAKIGPDATLVFDVELISIVE